MTLIYPPPKTNKQKTVGKADQNTKQYENRFEELETYPGSKELRGQPQKSELDIHCHISHSGVCLLKIRCLAAQKLSRAFSGLVGLGEK